MWIEPHREVVFSPLSDIETAGVERPLFAWLVYFPGQIDIWGGAVNGEARQSDRRSD